MKKKLEAELMSIAHKILQLKNKSDVEVLLQETQKLYEKLSVLKFVEENFSHLQPTIGKIEVEREMQAAFEAQDNRVQDDKKEEAFAERTQVDQNPVVEVDDSEDIAADHDSEKEVISENDESFEKEEELESESEEEKVSQVEQEEVRDSETETAETEIEEEDSEEEHSENSEEEEEEEEISAEDEEEEISAEDQDEELAVEENSEEDSEAVVAENTSEEDEEKEVSEEEEIEVLDSKLEEDKKDEAEEELEIPEAFGSEEETQVRTLEIGTAEAIANDEVLQDNLEDENSDTSERLFKPAFDWDFVAKEDEKPVEDKVKEIEKQVAPATRQFTFDDLLGSSYKDPVFVTPADLERERMQAEEKVIFETPIAKEEEVAKEQPIVIPTPRPYETPRTLSINDKLSKGIIVGLNDRIAFVKHLFANSNEDYNRVLSQMMTFNSMEEAQEFIEQMVKPDYRNWEGKEEYEERFLEVISKKFS